MEKKKITHKAPTPTDSPYILRIRELTSAMDIILEFALGAVGKAQHEDDAEDIDLTLYAIEANLCTLSGLLRDCTGYANMMH